MRSHLARVERIAARIPVGCGTCRSWGPVTTQVVLVDRRGTEMPRNPSRPDDCPTCGRRVPVHLRRRYLMLERADMEEEGV